LLGCHILSSEKKGTRPASEGKRALMRAENQTWSGNLSINRAGLGTGMGGRLPAGNILHVRQGWRCGDYRDGPRKGGRCSTLGRRRRFSWSQLLTVEVTFLFARQELILEDRRHAEWRQGKNRCGSIVKGLGRT